MTQTIATPLPPTHKRAGSVSAPSDRTKRVRWNSLAADGADTTDVDAVGAANSELLIDHGHTTQVSETIAPPFTPAGGLAASTGHGATESTVAPNAKAPAPIAASGTLGTNLADKKAFPDATTEAAAIVLLNALGAEPGALVGLDLAGLNGIYRTLVNDRLAAGLLPATPATAAAASLAAGPIALRPNSALEAFAVVGVPTERLAGKTWDQKRRLYSIMTYFDKARCISTLDRVQIPGEWDWGLSSAFNDASNFLCAKGTAKPLTVWVAGEVTNHYFYNDSGAAAKRVAISVQPLSARLHNTSKELLNVLTCLRNTSLVAAAFGPDQFRATRWMTVRGQRGQASSVVEFSDYYDARTVLKDKLLMEKIGVNQIMEHDLVLIETRIGRYNSEPAGEARGKKRVMNSWQSFYDLQAIYLIQNASAAATPVVVNDLII
ncbi:hypothetical protein B0H14DRAFT_3430577 [Mycena olivaceomarginata]|nr:hypothetical protein B0H14DRAFT_3430577 [Mycena olivaceomarginata]